MNELDPKKVISSVVNKTDIDIYSKINTLCLIIIAAVSITMALIYTKTILIPLVISVFIYTMITPVVRYIQFKFRLPKWPAIITAALLVLVPLVLLAVYMFYSAAHFAQVANIYKDKLFNMFQMFMINADNHHIPIPQEFLEFNSMQELLQGSYVTNFLKSFSLTALSLFSYLFLVIVFVFFLLLGTGSTKITNSVVKEIQNKVSAYLYIHIVISVLTGFCVGVVLVSTRLDLAVMFALVTIILNFIPNIGSIISVMLPLPIALVQFGPSPQFFVILIIPALIHFTFGSLLEPKLLGSGMDLHPVAVIGSLVFWTLVWGIVGAFLAVPITAAIRIVLSKIEPTRPFAEILAGRLPK